MKVFLTVILASAVMATAAAVPGTCYQCLPNVNATDDLATCDSEQQTKNCSLGDEYAIGTTHCFTVALRFKCVNGSSDIHTAVTRGCIDCSNKTAACLDFASRFKQLTSWKSLDCNMECCNSTNCNTQNVTVLPTKPPPTTPGTTPTPTLKNHVCLHLPNSGILLPAVIILAMFFLF